MRVGRREGLRSLSYNYSIHKDRRCGTVVHCYTNYYQNHQLQDLVPLRYFLQGYNKFEGMDRTTVLSSTGQQQPARVYKIDLSNRNLSAVGVLRQFEKVRCLLLSYNLIERIENLQFFSDLRELHMESNGVARIEGLEGNKALQVLNLAGNRIEKIQNLGHLIRLETLVLDSNRINKITGLQYLKQLKHLSVRKNCIQSVQNLPAFSKLATLNLSQNRIKNISSMLFSSSKALIMLDLSGNLIENTAFLQTLGSLESLSLRDNRIRELQVGAMPNLQGLDLSNNQIEKLPSVGVLFPELMSLDISHNMICSEHELLMALGETQYLTELDFRENPMNSEGFESAIQKIHSLDFLNGKVMTKAGAKYYQQVERINDDLREHHWEYGQDDQRDREIKMSGFFDEELEFRMSGVKAARPHSPKKKKNIEKPTFYEDIDRFYQQFVNNGLRIKVIREQYLKICGTYNISSQHILTELPADSPQMRVHSMEQKAREQSGTHSSHLLASEVELRKQNEHNLNKWKELKQREKSFNIRQVIKKSRGRDSSASKGTGVGSGNTWVGGWKGEKIRSELLRTQAVPKKTQELLRTMVRPSSVRKKE